MLCWKGKKLLFIMVCTFACIIQFRCTVCVKAALFACVSILLTSSFFLPFSLSPTQAYSAILVVMVILLNIGVAILFIHFFI